MIDPMRTLILGGTVFLSRTVAETAVRRGHDVVCAARGRTGSVPAGASLVTIDRNDQNGLRALADDRFDAVIDVAVFSHRWVADALAALADRAAHWTFVSSISVYSDALTMGQDTTAPLLEPKQVHGDIANVDPELYGSVKVACENAVRDTIGDRAFIVRPGLITGPGDTSDRFGYWPGRFSRGGRVLIPQDSGRLAQFIDVRDLAEWIVTAAEQRLTGTFDGIGPAGPLDDLLHAIDATAGTDPDRELVAATDEQLIAAGVGYWSGPKSLPLWVPPELAGFGTHDPSASLAAGLTIRPLADAVTGALATERELGLDRPRRAGLTAAEEAEVLASLA
jgi:nucleoside-diphosphate-sugar epimerase